MKEGARSPSRTIPTNQARALLMLQDLGWLDPQEDKTPQGERVRRG